MKTPDVRRAGATVVTLIAVWIAGTLPSTVVRCSNTSGPYASGLASWQLFMMISGVVVLPFVLVAGLIAAYARVPLPRTLSRRAAVAIPIIVLLIGAVGWLTARPGQSNCFP